MMDTQSRSYQITINNPARIIKLHSVFKSERASWNNAEIPSIIDLYSHSGWNRSSLPGKDRYWNRRIENETALYLLSQN